jgi:hypothetical protein
MRMPAMISAVLGLVVLAIFPGCGGGKIEAGNDAVSNADFLCYTKADAEDGGPSDRKFRLRNERRGVDLERWVNIHIDDISGELAKITIKDGRERGVSGWVPKSALLSPSSGDARKGIALRVQRELDEHKAKDDAEDLKAAAATARMAKSDRDDLDYRMTSAKEFEDKGQNKLAIPYYKDVVKNYPQSPEAKLAAERIEALEGK